MKADIPSNKVLDELKRYTQDLLSFFDPQASVKISTSQDNLVQLEVICKFLLNEQQVNIIALERIVSAKMQLLVQIKLKHK